MSVKDHLTEPWGIVTAALVGGLGGAVAAAVGPSTVVAALLGLGIGGVVYGVKVGVGIAVEPRPARTAARASIPDRPPAAVAVPWLRRAAAAEKALLAHQKAAAGPLSGILGDAAQRAGEAIGPLRQRAGAIAVVDTAAAGIEVDRLGRERAAFHREASKLPEGRLRTAKEASAKAAGEQLASHEQLVTIRSTLLAVIESTVLRLESAATQGSVLASMHAASSAEASGLDLSGLTEGLDLMRESLEETEELTRRLLAEQ